MPWSAPPAHIVMFGRPGSGKSSFAERLAMERGFVMVRTGELLREAVRRRDPLGVQVEPLLKAGRLVPDPIVGELLLQALKAPGTDRFIFDGFPRTIGQVSILAGLEKALSFRIDCYLEIALSPETATVRMSGRRVCPVCGATYHITNHPPRAEGICDNDGTPLERRPDDALEIIELRQRLFDEQTLPLLEYYREHEPERYRAVNGEQAFEAVYADVREVLGVDPLGADP